MLALRYARGFVRHRDGQCRTVLHVPDNCVKLALTIRPIRCSVPVIVQAVEVNPIKEDSDMATNPKAGPRQSSGLTRPGDLYVQGDDLPLPEVTETNTDSVWALWSDLVDENAEKEKTAPDKPGLQRDFLETVPLDLDAMAATQLMDLPDLPKDD